MELSETQLELRNQCRAFAEAEIAPFADEWDRREAMPVETLRKMGGRGYLGALIPKEYGGGALGRIEFGILNEELGRACSSARSLVTVHSMVCHALNRWGNEAQKRQWLPSLASGETIAAFALSEAEAGSDAQAIRTQAFASQGGYRLEGSKRWVTFGQLADLFLVFARLEDQPTAFLVPAQTEGLRRSAIPDMYGLRASSIAEVHLEQCWIPESAMLARPGMGVQAVASYALGLGRYSVAWGCVGIAQAALEASARYAATRVQFGKALAEHQLIQKMLSDMVTKTRAARQLCIAAGISQERRSSSALLDTLCAKYFASTAAVAIANDALQIHGAQGCSGAAPVQRFLRDAKIMEIIEGSSQIQQILIAHYGTKEYYL